MWFILFHYNLKKSVKKLIRLSHLSMFATIGTRVLHLATNKPLSNKTCITYNPFRDFCKYIQILKQDVLYLPMRQLSTRNHMKYETVTLCFQSVSDILKYYVKYPSTAKMKGLLILGNIKVVKYIFNRFKVSKSIIKYSNY